MSSAQGFEDLQVKEKNFLETAWSSVSAPYNAIPLIFESAPVTADLTLDYIEVYVREVNAKRISFGNPVSHWRIIGNVACIVYGRSNKGSAASRKIADQLRNILQGVRIDNIHHAATRVIPAGTKDTHNKLNVITDFECDYYK